MSGGEAKKPKLSPTAEAAQYVCKTELARLSKDERVLVLYKLLDEEVP